MQHTTISFLAIVSLGIKLVTLALIPVVRPSPCY